MDDISRKEYEEWIRKNKVPDYKRALYNDDPALVMSAILREQEEEKKLRKEAAAERAKLAELERQRSGEPRRNAGIYAGSGEDIPEEDAVPYDEAYEEDSRYLEDEDENIPEDNENILRPAPAQLYGDASYSDKTGSGRGGDRGEKTPAKPVNKEKKAKKEKTKEPARDGKNGAAKKKKKRKSSGSAWKYVLAAAVAAAIVLIIGISIVNSLDFGTFKLGYVTLGEVTEEGAATAYFARSSEALFSPASGIFMSAVSEGDRIEAGGTVGYIVKEENRSVLSKLRQINAKILALVSIVSDTTLSETEVKLATINGRLDEERAKLTEMALTGNISRCGDVENTVNSLIAERNALLMEAENGSDSILTLKREKEELEKIVNEKMVPVRSQNAGIVSFYISDSENVENELFKSLKDNDGSLRLSSLSLLDNAGISSKLNENVSENEKVCRIILDQSYYVILKINKQVSSLKGIVTVKSGDLAYQAAGRVDEADYGADYTVISTMRGLKSSLKSKNIEVTYDVSKSSGYCVPLTALSDWDKNYKTARLAVVKAGYVQFMYVGIKAWDSEKAIITSSPYDDAEIYYKDGTAVPQSKIATITAGTCYVVNAEKVHDGQQIS